ncbi:MAG: response regulator [Eubacteriaceae bacterium]|nr:response regulator [Eubacteriaceae bacterium]
MSSKHTFEQSITKQIFNTLREHVIRSRTTITVVFLGLYNENELHVDEAPNIKENITVFLKNEARKSDFVFESSRQPKWFIILSSSGEKEAAAFLRRLFMTAKNKGIPALENHKILFSASVAEIANNEGTFEELMSKGVSTLAGSLSKGPEQIEYISDFKKRPSEKIRISILDENAIFRRVLYHTLKNLNLEYFETEVKEFQDGYEFLESDWYHSSHTHLIIMNDILPRQSGLDVLHKIRMLPNNRRFIVFVMSKRNSQEDIIYAYESGADNYLIKPFNLRLLEIEIKRTFERLWT